MKCPKCQYDNDESIHYCQKCGEYLHEEIKSTMKEDQPVIQTVKVTDKKKLLKWIFSTFLFTAVIIGGFSLFQIHQIQMEANLKNEELAKKNKEQKDEIDKLSSQMDKSSVDYEKEIVELEKENNELTKKVNDLEKQVEELTSDQSSDKSKEKETKDETKEETSTDK